MKNFLVVLFVLVLFVMWRAVELASDAPAQNAAIQQAHTYVTDTSPAAPVLSTSEEFDLWSASHIDEDGVFDPLLLATFRALDDPNEEQLQLFANHLAAAEARATFDLPRQRAVEVREGVLHADTRVSLSRQFSSDRAGRNEVRRTALRGEQFATFEAGFQAEDGNHSPVLPSIWAYSFDREIGAWTRQNIAGYAVRRWTDYGAFLGNYDDARNDFRTAATVHYTVYAAVTETAHTVAFVLNPRSENGFRMERLRYGRPAITFTPIGREMMPDVVTDLRRYTAVALTR